MAALTGNQIDQSYQGLIKTTDNAALSGTAKALTDGVGGATNIQMSNTATNFVSGTVDFTGSTVSGLPAAGLVNGTGTSSLKNADSLVTNAATAAGTTSIALGDNAEITAAGVNSLAIGTNARATNNLATVVGPFAIAFGSRGIAIGQGSFASATRSIAIGDACQGNGLESTSLGHFANASAAYSVALGADASASANNAVAIGKNVTASVADYTTTKNLQLTNYASLNYADDTAAAAGGVPLGGIYHTSGALKIRIA